jgi:hypothetical protein
MAESSSVDNRKSKNVISDTFVSLSSWDAVDKYWSLSHPGS